MIIVDDGHAHAFGPAVTRRDVVTANLVARFGPRWWFQICDTCATVRLCPANNEFTNLPPESAADWEIWRQRPTEYEITQMR